MFTPVGLNRPVIAMYPNGMQAQPAFNSGAEFASIELQFYYGRMMQLLQIETDKRQ
jgi:hypothetical protein